MNTFITEDSEEIDLAAVVMVGPLVTVDNVSFYVIYLSSGQHLTIRESFKSRSDFLLLWKV